MTNFKPIFGAAFLLILIFSNEMVIVPVEGRHLNTKRKLSRTSLPRDALIGDKESSSSPDLQHQRFTTMNSFVEAFRPTSPGHSPGIGH
ncbi:hypothetical protein Syun_007693 [Stephania yunnanensis]|uniref:Uncharacterized protein n=1 Tax=Stephania yunnanensis TaxID=152371 RepID=A0AAP0KYW0_9MAGN